MSPTPADDGARSGLDPEEFRDEVRRQGVSETALSDRLDALRGEFTAGLTTAGVQIGAAEATLRMEISSTREFFKAQVSSLKLWGALVLVSGQTLGGIVAAYLHPSAAATAAHAVFHFFA